MKKGLSEGQLAIAQILTYVIIPCLEIIWNIFFGFTDLGM